MATTPAMASASSQARETRFRCRGGRELPPLAQAARHAVCIGSELGNLRRPRNKHSEESCDLLPVPQIFADSFGADSSEATTQRQYGVSPNPVVEAKNEKSQLSGRRIDRDGPLIRVGSNLSRFCTEPIRDRTCRSRRERVASFHPGLECNDRGGRQLDARASPQSAPQMILR